MKNCDFIGQVDRPATEQEMDIMAELVKELNVSDVEIKPTDMGCIVKAKMNRPIKKRLRNKEWTENVTEIRLNLYCSYGCSDYNKILEKRKKGDKNFTEFQYSLSMYTNGSVRGYRCRNSYEYAGKNHYAYDTELKELSSDLKGWFNNL